MEMGEKYDDERVDVDIRRTRSNYFQNEGIL